MRLGLLLTLLAGLLAAQASAQQPESKEPPTLPGHGKKDPLPAKPTEPKIEVPELPDPKSEVIELTAPNGSGPMKVYGSLEFLFWKIKDAPLPVPLLSGGVDNSETLIGGYPIKMGVRRGARITVGGWADGDEMEGIEASFLRISSGPVTTDVMDPTGDLRLANPFISALTGKPAVNQLSIPPQPITFIDAFGNKVTLPQVVFPGLYAGVNFTSRSSMYGFEGSGMFGALRGEELRADLLAGFRYFGLIEQMTMNSFSLRLPPISGDVYNLYDSFKTQSHFLGPQFGARASWNGGWWSADFTAKLAIGPIVQVTQVDGTLETNIYSPNLNATPTKNSGSIYAQDSNQGGSHTVHFAVIPEVQASVGIHFTSWLRGFAGYSLMYVNTVARPGMQIDPRINTNQSPALPFAPRPAGPLVGPALPGQPDVSSSFWAQGFNFGFEFTF